MFVFVDHNENRVRLELWDQRKIKVTTEYSISRHGSVGVLNYFAKFVGDNGIYLQDLKGIAVVKGPGSFTALRVIISTFNTLARVLDIPIIGIGKGAKFSPLLIRKGKFEKPVVPLYGAKPKTTRPKKK